MEPGKPGKEVVFEILPGKPGKLIKWSKKPGKLNWTSAF